MDNWYSVCISENIFANIEYYLNMNKLTIPCCEDIYDIAIILHVNHVHGVYTDYIMIPRIIEYLGIKVRETE